MTENQAAHNADVTWDAPDGGVWSLETAHYRGICAVPLRDVLEASFAEGFRRSFAELGLPLSHLELRTVNGWPYTSVFLHNAPRSAAKPPPPFVLKALARVHPAFRRRTKRATAALADRRAQRFATDWVGERESWIERNLELQRVELAALSDTRLADHLQRGESLFREATQRHFELVAGCIPLGEWFVRSQQWGLAKADVRQAVMHGTPVHDDAHRRVQRISAAIGDSVLHDLDAIRSHSVEAAAALDEYLDHHGRWATEDDVASNTLMAHPALIMRAIIAGRSDASRPAEADADALLAQLRTQIPADQRSEFDQLAVDAHRAYQMLDDNSGILASWVTGLVGETLRSTGRRLFDNGKLHDPEHIWALPVHDIVDLLRGQSSRDADDIATVAAQRLKFGELEPPMNLNGEPSPPPSPTLFPQPVARLVAAIGMFLSDKFNERQSPTGIGTRSVRGRAVITHNASDAIERLEPGDILITTSTTPAFNAVLAIVGGIIVTEGGPSCHAAIVARELGVPAIVGLHNAMAAIADGAVIELDPLKVTVTLV